MIFRALVEGGGVSFSDMDSFWIFFNAVDRLDAFERLQGLSQTLISESERYDIHNLSSRDELFESALEPQAFKDAYLLEQGVVDGKPIYPKSDDVVVFLVGSDRDRILAALKASTSRPY